SDLVRARLADRGSLAGNLGTRKRHDGRRHDADCGIWERLSISARWQHVLESVQIHNVVNEISPRYPSGLIVPRVLHARGGSAFRLSQLRYSSTHRTGSSLQRRKNLRGQIKMKHFRDDLAPAVQKIDPAVFNMDASCFSLAAGLV